MTRPFSPRTLLTTNSVAAILVTLAPLAYFQSAIRGLIVLAPGDSMIFNVPLRIAAANMLRNGDLPLWNPYIFSGMPLHAAAQGGLLFPLNWFFLLFEPRVATNLMVVSTYMVAALGAYLLARRLGSTVSGAVVTSVIYQSCGFLVGQLSHINIVQTAALLPWLIWAIQSYGERGDRRYGALISTISALQAFTGHQQTLVYSLLLSTVYCLVMWRASKLRYYLTALLLLAAGLLLASVQILPTYELMRNSVRSAASFNFFTAFSLPPSFLRTFVAPYVVGGGDGRLFSASYVGPPYYGELIGYVGIAALMLAVIAVILWRDLLTRFWLGVVIVGFALAFGGYWPFKLYAIVYYLPVLNLFRAPARHLMEIDLALAILAGRGLSALAATMDRRVRMRAALAATIPVFLITCLVVTWGRPNDFRLTRIAPVTLFRAPELFWPILMSSLSAWAIWRFARTRRTRALVLLVAVLTLDLFLWGHSSGWRVGSPGASDAFWRQPLPLRALPPNSAEKPYRILTAEHPFDPAQKVVGPMASGERSFLLWLQPDVYMMHGIENASGYDGFGLERYGSLCGDMTVWGELADSDRTLRGESRTLDILNVKYLMAMAPRPTKTVDAIQVASQASPSSTAPADLTSARGLFDEKDLGLPVLQPGRSVTFSTSVNEAERVNLLTNLSWAVDVKDGTKVGLVIVESEDGRSFQFELVAGRDTAEWAYDRSDLSSRIKHKQAKIGLSYAVEDKDERYKGHAYLISLPLPERVKITNITIEPVPLAEAPDLSLAVLRASVSSNGRILSLPREAARITSSTRTTASTSGEGPADGNGRWRRIATIDGVVIFENTRALPRVRMTGETLLAQGNVSLDVIRSGRLPDGAPWDPLRTTLVEVQGLQMHSPGEGGHARVSKHDPNRVEVKTSSASSAVLVLAENHYPGWRVYVDGRENALLRVNYNLRGVALTPGEHEVSFVFRPTSVVVGLVMSMVTALALTMWILSDTSDVIKRIYDRVRNPVNPERPVNPV